MRYSTSNLHREIFPVNERANYTSMSEKSLPPHGDYEMSLQPRSHNEYQPQNRSEEHTSELQSLMRISYAVFCLKNKNNIKYKPSPNNHTKHANPHIR